MHEQSDGIIEPRACPPRSSSTVHPRRNKLIHVHKTAITLVSVTRLTSARLMEFGLIVPRLVVLWLIIPRLVEPGLVGPRLIVPRLCRKALHSRRTARRMLCPRLARISTTLGIVGGGSSASMSLRQRRSTDVDGRRRDARMSPRLRGRVGSRRRGRDTLALPLAAGKGLVGVAEVLPALLRDGPVLAGVGLVGRVVGVVEGAIGGVEGFAADHVAGAADALEAGLDVVCHFGHCGYELRRSGR